MKILLVEDSATLRHAMSTYIRAAGHEPVIAETGEEALQLVEHTPVDMVIMDVEMPGLDGFETTRLIREWLGDHWIPIIFVTGRSGDDSLEAGIAAGGDDYLTKPVSRVIITAKIRAMERITQMRDQLNELNAELTVLSQRDSLTQLYNRRTFEERALEQWQIATRNQKPLTLLLVDIDHFKTYNDRYGHPEGDKCITHVSDSLAKCFNRPSDIVARYGGEEFIILLPNTPEDGARHVGEQARQMVEDLGIEHNGSSTSGSVTISVGGCFLNYTTGVSLQDQINIADKALYQSKKGGRNCVTINTYSPPTTVLVVDNDENNLALIQKSLDGHCSVISAKTDEECLQMAIDLKPDAILLEVYLPGVNGYKICHELKEDPLTASFPIILMSECHQAKLAEFEKNVNASGHLVKPLSEHRLIAKIDHFLKLKS